MKKNLVLCSLVSLTMTLLAGCFSQQSAIGSVETAFYPAGGDGLSDAVQITTIESPFLLPVEYKDIAEISTAVYEVDEESFFNNTIVGYAPSEEHIELAKFEKVEKLFEGDIEIIPDNGQQGDDDRLKGHIELPIDNYGYYYVAFTCKKLDANKDVVEMKFHSLLEVQENSAPASSFQPIIPPAKFELTDCGGGGCTKPVLELLDDRNFTMTINMCEGVPEVEGTYAKVDDEYFLAVDKCSSCKYDSGLSTVNLELKQVADDELLITNETYWIQDGGKYGFCAPTNYPHSSGGVEPDYNLFKLTF